MSIYNYRFSALQKRPELDAHDFDTARMIYGETQNWARHYEQSVINTNVMIISANVIFVGLAYGNDKITNWQFYTIFCITMLMSVVGIMLTRTLFRLFATCIERMIRIENILSCYDAEIFNNVDGNGPLIDVALSKTPIKASATVKFFYLLHLLLAGTYAGLMALHYFRL